VKHFSLIVALGVAVAFAVAPAVSLAADPPPVSNVVVINTNGQTDMLLSHAKKNEAIFKRLGIEARRRYLQATLAGENSGSVAVVIEYPNLGAMAAAQAKLQNDKEWQAYIDKIQGAGITVQSNAIWADITP
jgi:hypothetical protein